MSGELHWSHAQNPATFGAELSQYERDLLAYRRYKLALRAQSLAAAGYDLKRIGICCDCGEGTQHHRDRRCAECAKKLFDKQEADRLKAAAAVFATRTAA